MDAQHKADLERILANRRAGGRLKAHPVSSERQSSTHTYLNLNTQATVREKSPTVKIEEHSQTRPEVPPPSPPPKLHLAYATGAENAELPAAAQTVTHAAANMRPADSIPPKGRTMTTSVREQSEVTSLKEQLTEMQHRLIDSQRQQTSQLEQLSQGLRTVQETLSSGSVSSAPNRVTRSLVRTTGMMPSLPRSGPEIRGAVQRSAVLPLVDTTARNAPMPVDFASSFNVTSAARPPEPPHVARPLAANQIDVRTAIEILKTGEWWHKWSNKIGEPPKAQYVWLNSATSLIQWGRAPLAANALSNFIKAEDVYDVQTTEITEHIETRSFVLYVLVIKAHTRELRLGTELRHKLDRWYEALNNLIVFCRGYLRKSVFLCDSSD